MGSLRLERRTPLDQRRREVRREVRGVRSNAQGVPSRGGSAQDRGRVYSKGQEFLDQGSAGQDEWKAPHPAVCGRGGRGRGVWGGGGGGQVHPGPAVRVSKDG